MRETIRGQIRKLKICNMFVKGKLSVDTLVKEK